MFDAFFRYSVRHLSVLVLLAMQGGGALAQVPDKLPLAPEYLGEIRRSPDGKLKVVPEAMARVPSSESAAPATMIVGPGEKISTITEAAKLARDGEVIEIRAGE